MSVVLLERSATDDGRQLARLTLNSPRALNALNGEMIALLHEHLLELEADPAVVAVLLDASGEKAFCAGGDVVGLRRDCLAGDPLATATDFFAREYRLDHAIHTYRKPIIGWGSGIVMGGGMGLLCGCSHRVVTETTMMAMPEITIGLYPDVGGSWFLNRAPGRSGLFMGLTGARLNAFDARFVGFADRLLRSDQHAELLAALARADWSGDAFAAVSGVLRALEAQAALAGESPLRERFDLIERLTDHDDTAAVVAAITAHDAAGDAWLERAQRSLAHGSPLAAQLIAAQLRRTRHLSLAEVFRSELVLSVRCCLGQEFFEGVRALLVDKDGAPRWAHGSVGEVEAATVAGFFAAPWEAHPLADL